MPLAMVAKPSRTESKIHGQKGATKKQTSEHGVTRGSDQARRLDHEATKLTKSAKREGGTPRHEPSWSSRFVSLATLRGFVVQTLFVVQAPPCFEQPAIDPILLCQGSKRAIFDQAAAREHDYAAGLLDRMQAMGDDEGGATGQQASSRSLDQRLVGGIEVGSGLVEDYERRILEEGARQGDALRLTAAQSGPALADGRIVALREAADKAIGVGLPGSGHHLCDGGAGAAQADVIGNRAIEEVGDLRHPGDQRAPLGSRQRIQRCAVDADAAGSRLDKTQQQPDDRALASAARPHQRYVLARPDGEGHAVEGRTSAARVGVGNAPQTRCRRLDAVLQTGPRARLPAPGAGSVRSLVAARGIRSVRAREAYRCIEDRKDTPGGCHSGRGSMKTHAQGTQRQVELGSQDEHEQRLFEGKATIEQAQADLHRHHRRAEGRKQLQDQGRQEADLEHPHGRLTKTLADFGNDRRLLAAASEQLERGQALQHIQKVSAHATERAPLPPAEPLGQAADQDHENGDQGSRQQEDQAGKRIEGSYEHQDGEGHQGGQGKLGQILAEVGVERLDPLDQRVDQLAAALASRVAFGAAGGGVHRGGQGPPNGRKDETVARS